MNEKIIQISYSESMNESESCYGFYVLTDQGRIFEGSYKHNQELKKNYYDWKEIDLPDLNQ